MSTQETGERLAGETAARRTPLVTRMLAWSGVDAPRLEAARVVLGERSMRAGGSMVSAPHEGTEAYSASYSLATDEVGVVQRLAVRTTRVQGEQYVTLTRSEENIWLVDHLTGQGGGTVRTNFSGALDVDLASSPLFNGLPVRRLGLHRAAAQHDLSIVFVSLPDLEVACIRQTYRTVAVGETTVVGFGSDGLTAELTVDADGLVLDYPGVARRA